MLTIEKETIFEDDLIALATTALCALGVERGPAHDAARILAMADTMGLHTHGVSRLISYGNRLAIGGIDAKAQPVVHTLAPAMKRIDGANGLGPALGMLALREGIETARTTGIAIVFVAGSNHFGPIAPYAWLAAEEGFASLIASNASVTIAPSGGREARLGNNPLGFGFPCPGGDPIILDMAMSVVARAKIRDAAKAGTPIPKGWAVDADGGATTAAAAALKGFLLPVGGYKGYGLSLCVDMLTGLLSGASFLTHVSPWIERPEAPQNLGHTFILIDTAKIAPPAEIAGRMEDFAGIIHDTPLADPATPILVPGEREMARMHAAHASGIALPADLLAEIRAFGS
jgi:LDH2 family malate/lactate/ureidoglycolate dehydrogenase